MAAGWTMLKPYAFCPRNMLISNLQGEGFRPHHLLLRSGRERDGHLLGTWETKACNQKAGKQLCDGLTTAMAAPAGSWLLELKEF